MIYSMFKIISLKTEADFKDIITEVNQGSFTYFKCKEYLQKQAYYQTHGLRKNGVIAIAIQFKLHLDEDDYINENNWKNSTLIFCRDYLGINTNELLDLPSVETDEDKVKILFSDYDCISKKRLYTIVFTKIRKDGKVSLCKYSCAKRGWLTSMLKSYDYYMKNIFGMGIAPKEVFYNFLYNKNKIAASNADETDLKTLPFPMEGESPVQYYTRIKPFVERIRQQKDEEKKNAYNKLNSNYMNLKARYDVLKEQELKQKVYLARVGQLISIMKEFDYQDFRVLRSDLLQGQRIKAAKRYFDSRGDERGEESVKFIDYALETGKKYIEINTKDESSE